MMQWRRLGHIFVATGQQPWLHSHAAYPTVEPRGGDVIRVYFASRDAAQRSHIGFVEIDLTRPGRLLTLAATPVLTPGPRGSFDDSGVVPSCFLATSAGDYLYYMGWVNGTTVIARNSIGLARRDAATGIWHKHSPAPIIDRHAVDPLNITYSWVMPHPNGRYRLWYGSNLTWGRQDDEMQHVIKYAESVDGIDWRRSGEIAIPVQGPAEIAVSRPTVVTDGDGLHMWYCRRGEKYVLGYATSADGRNWRRRDDETGMEPDPAGWEQGSIHYPCVFAHRGQWFMLYNGGRFGSGGFGLAVLEK